ncbi:MAG: type II secretion system F family protein [Deltaproteobacteria bacterium]|nr:type II secretion system F family protein [Candidatus Tharpellaceae bacterium]
MPLFAYEAIDKNGNIIKKSGEFENEMILFNTLSTENLTLVDFKKIGLSYNILHGGFLKPKVKRKDLMEFCTNFSLLLEGGVSITEALDSLISSTKNRVFRKALQETKKDIEHGYSLSQGLSNRKIFPPIIEKIVSIGEETGELAKCFKDAYEHLKKVDEIISNTKRALTYPAFVIVAMSAAFIFWMSYVLPKLVEAFKGFEMKLPFMTRLLITISNVFSSYWMFIPIIIFGLFLFFILSRKNKRLRFLFDKISLKLPAFGTAIYASQCAFLFQYLSLMARTGTTILTSLDIMQKVMKNEVFKKAIFSTKENIYKGWNIYEAFMETKLFETFALRMISVGEKTGEMDKQLKYLSDFYFEKVSRMTETMSKTLEPIIIAIVGVFFIIFALGLIGPIYNMVSKVGSM